MRNQLFALLSSLLCVAAWAQFSPGTQTTVQGYRLDPISTENAAYPSEARETGIEGEVLTSLVVSASGDVTHAEALKGNPLLRRAAEEAVRKWKFKPVMVGDKAVVVFARATFKFALGDAEQSTHGVHGDIGLASTGPMRVRISSGVSTGLMVSKVNPIYPSDARRAGIQGTVILRAVIDRDGTILDLQPISGPEELVPASMEAVRQWRYKPYTLNGNPVEVETQVQINFTLSR